MVLSSLICHGKFARNGSFNQRGAILILSLAEPTIILETLVTFSLRIAQLTSNILLLLKLNFYSNSITKLTCFE